MAMLPASAYRAVFARSPVGDCLLSPDYIILDVNDVFAASVYLTREELIGKEYFLAFPDAPDCSGDACVSSLRRVFARVAVTLKPETIALQRYPIPVDSTNRDSGFEDRYWSSVTTPVLDQDGKLLCISHSTMDVTELFADDAPFRQDVSQDDLAHMEAGIFNRAQTVQEVNAALNEERARLRHLFDHAPSCVYFTKGPDHLIEQVNDAFVALAGGRSLVGLTMREAFPELEGQGFFEILDRVYQTGQRHIDPQQEIHLNNRGPNQPSEEFCIDMVFQPIINAEGHVTGVCGLGRDITAQKRAEDELRESEERWKLALEASGGGVWDVDIPSQTVRYSDTWKAILGYGEHEVGNTLEDWAARTHPDDRQRVVDAFEQHLQGHTQSFSCDYRVRCRNGGWVWILSRGAVVNWDEQGNPLRVIGTSIDISHSKRTEQQIWLQANFDALTMLPNRRLFRDRLEQEVAKASRTEHCVGLLFIDLDRFKEVNDLLGHDAGDMLLLEAGRRISDCVRLSDTVARLGGDEFTVILTELEQSAHVEEVAIKIIEALSAPFKLGQEMAYISGSVGITLYPDDSREPEGLIRNADQAMYWAKKSGRNQFRYFTRDLQEQAHIRLRLGGDLRNALAEGQFEVFYQPILDLGRKRISKAEALLRWHHPTLGLVGPDRFIPLAEELGLISPIGDWAFQQAVECSRRWSEQVGAPFEISVNRSAVQFMNQSSGVSWPAYLANTGHPSHIAVEITETMLVDASPTVAETLLQYRDAGIPVALDDFGTGYSSMAYLKKFDIDYLKIDQSFVHDIEHNSGSRTIARSIIVMAHELGLKSIAEGIEHPGQVEILREAGCDFGQGFLFSKPLPPAQFERLLQ